MFDSFDKESMLDATSLGLKAYYMHPESVGHYVSYPITELCVEFKLSGPPVRRDRVQYSKDEFLSAGFLGYFGSVMPKGAEELLSRYGLDDFAGEYFIGIFRDTDEYVKGLFLRNLQPWDQEETGVLLKHIGTNTPSRPFEYFYDPETPKKVPCRKCQRLPLKGSVYCSRHGGHTFNQNMEKVKASLNTPEFEEAVKKIPPTFEY